MTICLESGRRLEIGAAAAADFSFSGSLSLVSLLILATGLEILFAMVGWVLQLSEERSRRSNLEDTT